MDFSADGSYAIVSCEFSSQLLKVDVRRQRLDGVLTAARRGATFKPQELLALQADAYRYSQTIEVASRVVEHAAHSVKQAVNTSV
jgi:hypothetical protein